MIALFIDALAAYRLTRLARTDTITLPLRDRIEARSVEVVPRYSVDSVTAREGDLVDVQPYAFLRDLLDCAWCTSMYGAAATLLLGRWRWGRALKRMLAVAAVAGGLASMLDDSERGAGGRARV